MTNAKRASPKPLTHARMDKRLGDVRAKFDTCWSRLAGLKNFERGEISVQDVLEFQPILSEALLDLEFLRLDVVREKVRLGKRKRALAHEWFVRRMQTLDVYEQVITDLTGLGKMLGDAYAWYFYQNDRERLLKQAEGDKPFHVPSCVGGIAELEFISRYKSISGFLVLYHGMTNILRQGDFSLIDLKSLKVVAIGELKAIPTGDDKGVNSTYIVANKDILDILTRGAGVAATPSLNPSEEVSQQVKIEQSPSQQRRLNRQLQDMARALRPVEFSAGRTSGQYTSNLDSMWGMAEALKRRTFAYAKLSPGLVLCGYRPKKQTLASKVKQMRTKDEVLIPGLKSDFVQQARMIADVESTENRLHLAGFQYGGQPAGQTAAGAVPFFWWPLPLPFLRQVIFHDVLAVSLFNDLHFHRAMEAKGFALSYPDGKTLASRTLNEKTNVNIPLEPYYHLIMQGIFSEDAVVDMLDQVTMSFAASTPSSPTAVRLSFDHKIVVRPQSSTESSTGGAPA